MKVRHIDAVFGGERVRFAMRQEPLFLALHEQRVGGSYYHALRQLSAGHWSIDLVQTVLSLAHPASQMGLLCTAVTSVLQRRPPGIYAILAMKILEAHLFGVPEDEATFDETIVEAARDAAAADG